MQQGYLPPFFLAANQYCLYAQVQLAAHRTFERFAVMAADCPDGRLEVQVVVAERSGRRTRLVNDREKAAALARRWPGRPVRYAEIRLSERRGHGFSRVEVRFRPAPGYEVALVLLCPARRRARPGFVPYPGIQAGGYGLAVGMSLAGFALLPGSHAVVNGRRCALAAGKSRWLRRPLVRGVFSRSLLQLEVGYPPARLGPPQAGPEGVQWALPAGGVLRFAPVPGGEGVYQLQGWAGFAAQQMELAPLEGGGMGLCRLQAGQARAEFSPPWPLEGQSPAESEVSLWLGPGQKRALAGRLERRAAPGGQLTLLALQGGGRGLRLAYRQRQEGEKCLCEVAYDRL